MKKTTIFAVCTVCVLSMTGCANTSKQTNGAESSKQEVQIPNPFVECSTIKEAEKCAGFSITVPEEITGFEQKRISAVENDLIQLDYENDQEEQICIRKGTGVDDISGDYNEYSNVRTVTIDGRTVTFKGEDDQIMTAVWKNADFAYAVCCTGMSEEDVTSIIKNIQ